MLAFLFRIPASVFVLGVLLVNGPVFGQSSRFLLKDGRSLNGNFSRVYRIDETAEEIGKPNAKTILLIDDGLRRTYVPRYRIAQISTETSGELQRYRIHQRGVSTAIGAYGVLGEYDTSIPFDEYGRRAIPLRTPDGVEYALQAITEINPRYIRVQGTRRVWDMRVATNAVPRNVLTPVILRQIDDPGNLEERLGLVRFYIQSSLYKEAAEEVGAILEDFAGQADVQERLAPYFLTLRQREADQWYGELELRFQSGQYRFVHEQLKKFKNEGMAAEMLQKLRRLEQRYENMDRKRSLILGHYDALTALLENPDASMLANLAAIRKEIEAELNFNTIERFSLFELHWNNKEYDASRKLALAISGWFVGTNVEVTRLSTAVSLFELRRFLAEYLVTSDPVRLEELAGKMATLESHTASLIAKLLAYMKPPQKSDPPPLERPGYHELEREGFMQTEPYRKYRYLLQLPPEYDPNRRYPAVISLHGATSTPQMQLDWWAGSWKGMQRSGHAMRHGYIVIAPFWNPENLLDYDFSAAAHGAVLLVLRDVFSRFNVDTDRVYLSGHGIGGDAAWDIGGSHPDLWAGVMPIGGVAGKYINVYSGNMHKVPFYYVGGELEGYAGGFQKLRTNAPVFNNYLQPMTKPFEATVVLFRGRGNESFSDEQLRLFDWMKRHTRNFHPREFAVRTLRPWDNFFWSVEVRKMGDDAQLGANMIDPIYWPNKDMGINAPKNAVRIEAEVVPSTNSLRIRMNPTPKDKARVQIFLTPETIDFQRKGEVLFNGQPLQPKNGFVEPNIEEMLQDARLRGDRLHPFWARLPGDGSLRSGKTGR